MLTYIRCFYFPPDLSLVSTLPGEIQNEYSAHLRSSGQNIHVLIRIYFKAFDPKFLIYIIISQGAGPEGVAGVRSPLFH